MRAAGRVGQPAGVAPHDAESRPLLMAMVIAWLMGWLLRGDGMVIAWLWDGYCVVMGWLLRGYGMVIAWLWDGYCVVRK